MVSSATGKSHLSRRQVGVGRKPRMSGNPTHRHHSPAYKRDINFQQKTEALGIQTKVWADISRWKTFCLPLIYKGAELFQNLYINSFYEWNTLTHSSKINYLLRWFIKIINWLESVFHSATNFWFSGWWTTANVTCLTSSCSHFRLWLHPAFVPIFLS